MPYKYLLFDADNTLFDFDTASKVAFDETLAHFNIPQKEDRFSIYLKVNKSCWERLEKGEITPKEIKSLRFEEFLKAIKATGNPLEINDFYLECLSQKALLLPGAGEMLSDFHARGYSLSLITNGLQAVQRRRLEKAGLTALFSAITVSEEIGIAKPHPDFFVDTFRQLNAPPHAQVLVIGDTLTSDILGGNNIGVDTLWFNPTGTENKTTIKATYEVRSFEDLKKVVYNA